jgi:hypothetical protein
MTDERRWGDAVAAMLRCVLCHREGFDVKVGVLCYRDEAASFGRRYEDQPSCTDRTACRERVELHGKPWPLWQDAPSLTLPGFGEP